ncbi:hypothetical protein [Cronobacter sakazakii]|uniref:hypothetical protein n=1 Tax=Cronobacter sakazakii TaxID=28141 RepID=UPI0015C56155
MEESLKGVHKNMIALGCGSLGHANYLAHFTNMIEYSWNQLAVLQAAHCCEIFLKARLAQEHPLLIFESLPKSTSQQFNGTGKLDFDSLIQSGRTIEYSSLPEKVWAATGFRFSQSQLELYKKFGALRNSIQHFAAPNTDLYPIVTQFIYEVIDPFINEQWGLFAIDFCDDSEPYENLVPLLAMRNTFFLIPPTLGARVMDLINDGTPSYIARMRAKALDCGYIK